jgi:shikimate kinase/3-dehydroquinate synthase
MTRPVRNVVLTGFMGAGKTVVGRELAALLGRRFVDLDEAITAGAGMTVPEIFAAEGEDGFRRREKDAALRMSAPAGLVLAVGGGTVLDTDSREALRAGGDLVMLRATAETLAARLAHVDDRPLLVGHQDRRARIAELLAARDPAYAAADLAVDTDDLPPPTVAAVVAARLPLALDTLPIPVPGHEGLAALAYRQATGSRVAAGRGAACRLGALLREVGVTGRVVLAMPDVIKGHYLPRVAASLTDAGLPWDLLPVRDGDGEKTFDQVAGLVEQLADLGADRGTCLIAMGGGVTGDLVGFTAACYMRGLGLVMVPTTLLAMVDAHIGGKTGVNSSRAKNMAGAFWPPLLVAADPCLLATLPDRELAGGLAEVVKTALIGDAALFHRLETALVADVRGDGDPRRDPDLLEDCVTACARVKGGVVSRDPWELGERRLLNLGHTLGHALEAQSSFGLSHGEAVSLGLVAALHLAVARGAAAGDLLDRTRRLLAACGLPVTPPDYDEADLRARLRMDKKNRDGRLRFVVPHAAGDVRVADDVDYDEALAALAAAAKERP